MAGWAGGRVLSNSKRWVENVKGVHSTNGSSIQENKLGFDLSFKRTYRPKVWVKQGRNDDLIFYFAYWVFLEAILSEKIYQELKLYHWLNVTLRWLHCFGKTLFIHSTNIHYLLPWTHQTPLSPKIFAWLFSLQETFFL